MRILAVALVLLVAPGCTYLRLQRSILNQASTLTELQYQQVLGNLAMLSFDPYALPAHANLRDGSAQISDFGALAAGPNLVSTANSSPTLTGSRTVVEQWGITPVTDDNELKLLGLAYRRALGFPDILENDFADDLAHAICLQISNTDDVDLHNDLGFNLALFNQLMNDIVVPEALPPALKGSMKSTATPVELSDRLKEEQYGDYLHHKATIDRINSWRDAINYNRVQSNDEFLVSEFEQNLSELNPSFMLWKEKDSRVYAFRATPQVREARRQVKQIHTDLMEIHPGWFGIGGKRDIPKNACYVGRFRDHYAWVCPEGCQDLAKFTRKILSFSSLIKDQTILTIPGGGPRFTPAR